MVQAKQDTDQTFLTHLSALRKCLVKIILIVFTAFLGCAYFSKDIYTLLSRPLAASLSGQSYFIATHPFEAWGTYLKTAVLSAVFLSLPLTIWHIWRFVSPGLYQKEKKLMVAIIAPTYILFLGGAFFGYFVVLPYVFAFFTGILEGTDILFLPQMKDTLNFSFKLLATFGLTFELPVIMILLAAMGLVSFEQFKSVQKYMIVLAFVVAAILTPPDVVSQIIMAIPLILLYEVGLGAVWMFRFKKGRSREDVSPQTPTS